MPETPLISFRIEKTKRDKFQKLYPYCLSQFLRKAIILAIRDRELFQKIYFSEV